MKKITTLFLVPPMLMAFDKVAFNLGVGNMSFMHRNTATEQSTYVSAGAHITYPWFDTSFFSSAVVDFMVFGSSNPDLYDPTATKTFHELGLLSTLGFSIGVMPTDTSSLYAGLKYSNLSLSGVAGEGFALSVNFEFEIDDAVEVGMVYRKGELAMYLADNFLPYESIGLYLNFLQEPR